MEAKDMLSPDRLTDPLTDAAGRRLEGWTAVPSEFTIRRAIQLAVEGS